MSIIAKEISSKFFDYNGRTKVFAAEVSDLPFHPIGSKIYDDACDVGFRMVSERTGEKLLFSLYHVDQNQEYEVQGWWFKAVSKTNLSELKVLVIND